MREFALESYFSRWEFAVRYNLAAADSETMAMQDLLALAEPDDAERWRTLRLGYTDPRGADWLRATIAAQYESLGRRTTSSALPAHRRASMSPCTPC